MTQMKAIESCRCVPRLSNVPLPGRNWSGLIAGHLV
jgi:hypothetical protein